MAEIKCGKDLVDAFNDYWFQLYGHSNTKHSTRNKDSYLADWLIWRIRRVREATGMSRIYKIRDMPREYAAQIYADMIAAFPLETVPLDNPSLPVTPVPYQVPFSVTPEIAERVWAQLREHADPSELSLQQVMEILKGAAGE